MKLKRLIFSIGVFFSLFPLGFLWATSQNNPSSEDSTIQLTSDRMFLDERKKTVVFEGHVFVKRSDITITADRLYLYGKQNERITMEKPLGDQLDRIEVEGNVRIIQGNKVASAEKGIYYVEPQKILLIGNPIISQGQDRISGQMITIYLKEGRSVVEGGQEKPVQVIIAPSKGLTEKKGSK
ncbi:MAG: lipopolysaccharide transport periplasmic protein LptA [Syntrophobacterales bacterium]|nr:lipopolysaccharide transport periplasmic protein LptA [Syntrophobacterales bacterium]